LIEPRMISLYKKAGFYLEDLIGGKVAASVADAGGASEL